MHHFQVSHVRIVRVRVPESLTFLLQERHEGLGTKANETTLFDCVVRWLMTSADDR